MENMKKLMMAAAVAALAASCCGSANKYTLQGTADAAFEGATVLLKYGDRTDSAVVENGKFLFEGVAEAPVLARAMVQKDRNRAGGMVILEPGAPTIVLGEEETMVAGTPLNDALAAYNKQNEAIYTDYREGYTQLNDNAELSDEQKHAEMGKLREQIMGRNEKLHSDLFAANNNNPLGAMAMLQLAGDKAQFDSLYNIAGEAVRNNESVVKEKQRYENIEKTAEGKMFTDFTIENGSAEGTPVSLSDYVGKGKYVLVDFWASWCGPCRGEMPNLAEVYKKFKGDKFEIVGVAVWDKRADTEKALTQLPITWPVIFDAQQVPTDIYGINGIPQIILFGPDGTIVARDLRGEAIGKKVAECLKK